MADKETREPEFGVSQHPGGFVLFWHLLVPLSVILSIHKFGLRRHEVGLILALSFNPYVLKALMQSVVASSLASFFLIIWIERILSRWVWYKIYSWEFLRNIILLFFFVAVPSFITRFIWRPMTDAIRALLKGVMKESDVDLSVSLVVMTLASLLLLHSIYLHGVQPCFPTRGYALCRRQPKPKP